MTVDALDRSRSRSPYDLGIPQVAETSRRQCLHIPLDMLGSVNPFHPKTMVNRRHQQLYDDVVGIMRIDEYEFGNGDFRHAM